MMRMARTRRHFTVFLWTSFSSLFGTEKELIQVDCALPSSSSCCWDDYTALTCRSYPPVLRYILPYALSAACGRANLLFHACMMWAMWSWVKIEPRQDACPQFCRESPAGDEGHVSALQGDSRNTGIMTVLILTGVASWHTRQDDTIDTCPYSFVNYAYLSCSPS